MVINCIEGIRDSIDDVDNNWISDVQNEAADQMAIKFQKYFSENATPKQYIIAHILDPRFKLSFAKVKDGLTDTTSNPSHSTTNYYRNCIRKCYNSYYKPQTNLNEPTLTSTTNSSSFSSTSNTTTTEGIDGSTHKSKSFFSNQLNAMKRAIERNNETTSGSSASRTDDLDEYLKEDVFYTEDEVNFEVAVWWKINGPRFPNLHKMAKDFLAIQAGSVAAESAFSTSGRVATDSRSSFNPETVTKLLLGQDWLRALAEYKNKTKPYKYNII